MALSIAIRLASYIVMKARTHAPYVLTLHPLHSPRPARLSTVLSPPTSKLFECVLQIIQTIGLLVPSSEKLQARFCSTLDTHKKYTYYMNVFYNI